MSIYKNIIVTAIAFLTTSAMFAASSNANLDAIEVSDKGVNVVTGFASATTAYTFSPSPAATQVTLRAVPSDKNSTVAIKIGATTYSNHSFVTLPAGSIQIIFSVTAQDGTTKKDYTVDLNYSGGGGTGSSLETTYYSTNPAGGVGKYSQGMTVTCTAMKSDGFADWSSDMIIAQGVANDIAQSFKGGHEGPLYDSYALYAAWDDTNLYLGWQYVNVVDVVDPAQGFPISDNGKPWNGNIPIALAFDIDPAKSATGKVVDGAGVWDAPGKAFKLFDNGLDVLAMFSSKPGVGQPAIFKLNSAGTFDYATGYSQLFSAAGVVYGYIDGLKPATVFGINKNSFDPTYLPSDLTGTAGFVDFVPKSHAKSQDTFYEMKIPLSALGITKAYLESTGIGVSLISTFGESGTGSLPYDPTVYDHVEDAYGPDASSSAEKNDVDTFTYKMARIGKK